MKTKGMIKTRTRQTVYLRIIKGENYIVAGSIKPVVWSDQFNPTEDDSNDYQTLVLEVPTLLAKKLDLHGTDEQVFEDGYEAYKKTKKYLTRAETI